MERASEREQRISVPFNFVASDLASRHRRRWFAAGPLAKEFILNKHSATTFKQTSSCHSIELTVCKNRPKFVRLRAEDQPTNTQINQLNDSARQLELCDTQHLELITFSSQPEVGLEKTNAARTSLPKTTTTTGLTSTGRRRRRTIAHFDLMQTHTYFWSRAPTRPNSIDGRWPNIRNPSAVVSVLFCRI